ncbi:aldehyde dehydrogenase family protein [Nocardioides hungaricus]
MDHARLTRQYIDGQWRPGRGDKVLVDTNPFNGDVLGEIAVASREDVDDAYQAASRSQQAWEGVNAYEKRTVLERAAAIVGERRDEIVALIVAEGGSTVLKANFEVSIAIDSLKEAASLPLRIEGRIYPSPVADAENFVYRRPVGVVGVISPYNTPFFLSMRCVAPALAAGNGVVLKPHEETPLTGGTLFASIFEEAGLPSGLLNVVVTEIPTIGDHFLEHPVPRVLAFTGSTAVGRHVGEVAARHFKKAILELGGNNAFIVCDDADLDLAVDAAVFSRFMHQGQVCMAANRILVHSAIAEEFSDRFVTKVRSLTMGDPADPSTVIGPLISKRQVAALEAQVEAAVSGGARPLVRGGADGNVLAPIVLEAVNNTDDIARGELFGPVVLIMQFDDDEEAVAIANDTVFGLSGAIHTRDLDRGVRLARRLSTAMVHINDSTIADEPLVPFGGEGQSGTGRLNGTANIEEFTTTQWISVNHGRPSFPY